MCGNMNFEDTLKEVRLIGEETDRKIKRVENSCAFFWGVVVGSQKKQKLIKHHQVVILSKELEYKKKMNS